MTTLGRLATSQPPSLHAIVSSLAAIPLRLLAKGAQCLVAATLSLTPCVIVPQDGIVFAAGLTDPTAVVTPAPLPLPTVGVPFSDPVFGTVVRRVSETSSASGFETHIYNQLQAFSSDNAYLLLTGSNGYVIRRVSDFSLVSNLDTSAWNAPRWHPTQPHTIVHFDSNDDTIIRLQFTNVDALTTETIFTFPAQYQYVRVSQSFDELSTDGRWLAGMVTRNDGVAVLFALDIHNGILGAQLPVRDLYGSACQPDPVWGQVEPDWIAVSPLGRYLVVQWVRDGITRCSGLETFNLQTGAFVGRVSDHHHHGDLGVGTDGVTEFFMTTELSSPADPNRPALAIRELPGTATASQPRYLQVMDWSDEDHFSCQGPHGVCLVSWGRLGETNDWPFDNELFLQYTDGSVRRLMHHRSSKCGYWVQPRASLSRDGRYVVFASDWWEGTGTNHCGDVYDPDGLGRGDPYIIDLQASSPPPTLPPALQIQLNGGAFQPGQVMTVTATLVPGTAQISVDAYVVIRLPDGSFWSLQIGGGLIAGIVPIASGFMPVVFAGELLRYVFSGGEPSGTYTWFTALTQAGTLDIIGTIEQNTFTYSP